MRYIAQHHIFPLRYPDHSVNTGYGNVNAKLVVVHHDHVIPERDGTSGALKRFNLLDEVYRVPSIIVQGASQKENRQILKELLEIVKPLLVVTSGEQATQILKNKVTKSPKGNSSKEFLVEDLTTSRFYAILNPEEYSFARAPARLKERGRVEWERLVSMFQKLYDKFQSNRWEV